MDFGLAEIAEKREFAAFMHDGDVRHGLPPIAYTAEAYWRLENATLFQNHWVFVGFVHEIARVGDVVPTTTAGMPIFLVRGEDGEIRAFHNICLHRCLKLVENPGNVGRRIRCPYHSWTYDLDGALRATPSFGGTGKHTPDGFDSNLCLHPIRCEVWHDWIFVNLGDDAGNFVEFINPIAERLSDIDFDGVTAVATLDFGEIKTNWKFLMENFIEPYHVQFVHAQTTSQPLADHSPIVDGHCLGSAVDISRPVDDGDTLAVDSRYLGLFPNFVLGRYFPDQLGVHLNIPVSAGCTHQRRVIYATEGKQFSPDEVEKLKILWRKVHAEDHEICTRLQLGRASAAAADGGWLSPHWEGGVRQFQELALAAVKSTTEDLTK